MKKVKPNTKVRDMIDSLAQINEELKRLNDAKKDLDTLIKKYLADKQLDSKEEYMFVGNLYQCDLGKVPEKREIKDIKKVRDFLGDKAFMDLATIKLSDIDTYLTTAQKEAVLVKKRSGTRQMKFSQLPPKSNLNKKA